MNLVLKPYYEDYDSLMLNEELDSVKFSLSDQYQHKYNSFCNILDSILHIQENKQDNLLLN